MNHPKILYCEYLKGGARNKNEYFDLSQ